jgi:diguanylate cyclase (GGDEF)-like protein/PAS domain S-box-containing protein
LPEHSSQELRPEEIASDERLRKQEVQLLGHHQLLVDLAKRRSLHAGDLQAALREITVASAAMLGVSRVGVWLFNASRSSLRCALQFDATTNQFPEGMEISSAMHPEYFTALESERIIAIQDTTVDPRTSALADRYHQPLGIKSLLDAPVRHAGRMVGVVCNENVGTSRTWTADEENFAASMADLVAMALDGCERKRTEDQLRYHAQFDKLISGISTNFINLSVDEVDDAIHSALQSIGTFVEADRSYVMMIDPSRKSASLAYEWAADASQLRTSGTTEMPIADYPWYTERLRRFENIYVPRVSDLPPEAAREKRLHEAWGTKSLVAVPMVYHKSVVGFLGFNSTTREDAWSEDTIALLKIVGEIFVSTIERKRVEKALRSSEKHHRLLFERNLAGVYRNTLDGRILDCNDALARILGYEDREELIGAYADNLYFEQGDREGFLARLRQHGHFSSVEICLRRKDGTPVWLLESVSLVHDGEREILEGTLIDISRRKLTEDALAASERRYRALVERMREGMRQVDNDDRIEFVNQRYCELVGYSREELLGQIAYQLLAFPDDHDLIRKKNAERRQGISDQYEIRVRRKNGQVIWMEIGAAPVVDATGAVVGSIGVHNDVTARKLAEAALRESEARYRLMAENSTDMISRHAVDGTNLYVSPACTALLGYEAADMIGLSCYDFIHPLDQSYVADAQAQMLEESVAATISYRIRHKSGSYVWFESTSRPLSSPEGDVREVIAVSRDISERKQVEEQIEYQAYHDALTGLPNRLLFKDRLTVALAHARRLRRPLAVMFLDLDHFKLVNDTLGHSTGDQLLKIVAQRLQESLREEDTIARMGGDEFTVLLSRLNGTEDAAMVARKLLETIAQPIAVDGRELFITTSIGIAICPHDGDNAEILLKNADNAMYRAKESGRSSYQLCTPAMNVRVLERLALESSLRRALERDEFIIHYQPQINLASGAIVGMEALLRWQHPDHGIVPPATFIPVAEDTRMIVEIGEWVLRQACMQARRWHDGPYPMARVAVNLSPRQFQHSDLQKMIADALDFAGLDPHFLELEITEGTAMQNTERTIATLNSLREMGVMISIDDFGTGHSSLNYLRTFPIDSIKLDQTFVHEIEVSRRDRAIVSAVISMAHGLGLRVTAEGVETEGQLDFLRSEGCDDVQGFYFGAAVAADRIGETANRTVQRQEQ